MLDEELLALPVLLLFDAEQQQLELLRSQNCEVGVLHAHNGRHSGLLVQQSELSEHLSRLQGRHVVDSENAGGEELGDVLELVKADAAQLLLNVGVHLFSFRRSHFAQV